MKPTSRFTSIGGQAVIEGVMMRSPHFISVAVRKPNRKIVIRTHSYASLGDRYSWLKRPLFRGVVMLVESMKEGMEALGFSASIASQETQGGNESELSNWEIAGSMVFALVFGLGLFVAVPHGLTAWITSFERFRVSAQSPIFHLIDGSIKLLILISYVFLISQLKDIYRVFQYHGAEHKSIYTFEANEDLTVENARKKSTLHPRCGTSFLLFLVLISVLIFSVVFPFLKLTEFSSHPIYNHLLMILTKVCLMLPVAGLAYEVIRLSAVRMNQGFFRFLIWPGLTLQKLTTREPTDEQLEVALASLRQVLLSEKSAADRPKEKTEFEILSLSDLGWVPAHVSEFLES